MTAQAGQLTGGRAHTMPAIVVCWDPHPPAHSFTLPTAIQVYLLMRTLRDMNMSKYVAEDVPLFMSLIDDLFPGGAWDAIMQLAPIAPQFSSLLQCSWLRCAAGPAPRSHTL